MFQLRWLKRYIRRNTRRIPEDKAVKWTRRLSLWYMIFAWHAFGGILYLCYTGRQDWMRAGGIVSDADVPPARSWARILGVKNAQVISISGRGVTTYEIREDDGYDYENPLNNLKPEVDENKGK